MTPEQIQKATRAAVLKPSLEMLREAVEMKSTTQQMTLILSLLIDAHTAALVEMQSQLSKFPRIIA